MQIGAGGVAAPEDYGSGISEVFLAVGVQGAEVQLLGGVAAAPAQAAPGDGGAAQGVEKPGGQAPEQAVVAAGVMVTE